MDLENLSEFDFYLAQNLPKTEFTLFYILQDSEIGYCKNCALICCDSFVYIIKEFAEEICR